MYLSNGNVEMPSIDVVRLPRRLTEVETWYRYDRKNIMIHFEKHNLDTV